MVGGFSFDCMGSNSKHLYVSSINISTEKEAG
jgi:hypothetical protein